MAGYSTNPLVKKLGIKDGQKILLLNIPDHYVEMIGDWPPDICIESPEDASNVDFIHFFTTEMAELEVKFAEFKSKLSKTGSLWISWPKGSSKLPKDLNGNDVRRLGLEAGLVDVKVCAIDQDWSGLKFMFRKRDR